MLCYVMLCYVITNTLYLREKVKIFKSAIRSDHSIWLLHVHEHLLKLNIAAYSLEMLENIGKFIWLICLEVMIG